MTLNGLLPCPFCGGKAERVLCQDRNEYGSLIGFPFWAVKCKSCAAEIWNPEEQDGLEPDEMIEVAVKAWNTRAPGWIPCSERMPEEHDDVLVAMKSGKYKSIHIGYTYNSGDWMIDGEFWYEEGDPSITHWMPLPKPPKGDAE